MGDMSYTPPFGGSGDSFWQLLGGGDNDIELNTGAGVTGIFAMNPSSPAMGLLLTGESGFTTNPIAGFAYNDLINGLAGYVGIVEGGSTYTPEIFIGATGDSRSMKLNFGIGPSINLNLDFVDILGNTLEYNINGGEALAIQANGASLFALATDGTIETNQIIAGAPLLPATMQLKISDTLGNVYYIAVSTG